MTPESLCRDEITMSRKIGDCFLEFQLYQHPIMRGVIYLSYTKNVTITDSIFTFNDNSPSLEPNQIVGMPLQQFEIHRASAIFLDTQHQKVIIERCNFTNNTLDFLKDYIMRSNLPMLEYFPSEYFNSSHSSVISIFKSVQGNFNQEIVINDCIF